jgi:hypothetical protein
MTMPVYGGGPNGAVTQSLRKNDGQLDALLELAEAGGSRDLESRVSAGTSVNRESYWAAALDGRIFGKFRGRLFAKNKRFLQRIRAEGITIDSSRRRGMTLKFERFDRN